MTFGPARPSLAGGESREITMEVCLGSCSILLGSILLTLLVRKLAHKVGMVAAPRADRWHKKPTALLGGVAIFAAFLAGYLAFASGDRTLAPVVAGGGFLFIVGLVDDVRPLKPYTKLIAQLMAAAVVVYFGLHLPWTGHLLLDNLLTIFWLVGITNAVNLLDNMDGLAGGISLIACLFLLVSFLLGGQTQGVMTLGILAASVLGFLVFNFKPATIFMGDCGSMFLGFTLGGISLISEYGRSRNLTAVLLTPVLILLIPIFDTTFVAVMRKLHGRRVSEGGRDHTSHRLVALGMTEQRAVLTLYLFAGASGTLALLVQVLQAETLLVLIPMFALGVIILGLSLGKVRVYEQEAPPAGSASLGAITRALGQFYYKRRILEVLLDVLLMTAACYGALLLRFEGNIPREQLAAFVRSIPLILAVQMAVFWLGGVYRGLWSYIGAHDLTVIGKSVVAGCLASAAVVLFGNMLPLPSRAVLILNPLLLFLLVTGSRASFRMMRVLMIDKRPGLHPETRPVLIYGASEGSELLVHTLLNHPEHRFSPVGFVDDDSEKVGRLLNGYRIYDSSEVPHLIDRHGIHEVLVSGAHLSEGSLRAFEAMGVALRRVSITID